MLNSFKPNANPVASSAAVGKRHRGKERFPENWLGWTCRRNGWRERFRSLCIMRENRISNPSSNPLHGELGEPSVISHFHFAD
jgi:hypothetical protein